MSRGFTSYHYLSQAINRQGPFPRLHQVSLPFLTPRYIPFLSSCLPFLRIPDVSRHRLEHLFQVIGRVPHLGCDRPTIVLCFPSSSDGFLNVAKQTRHNKWLVDFLRNVAGGCLVAATPSLTLERLPHKKPSEFSLNMACVPPGYRTRSFRPRSPQTLPILATCSSMTALIQRCVLFDVRDHEAIFSFLVLDMEEGKKPCGACPPPDPLQEAVQVASPVAGTSGGEYSATARSSIPLLTSEWIHTITDMKTPNLLYIPYALLILAFWHAEEERALVLVFYVDPKHDLNAYNAPAHARLHLGHLAPRRDCSTIAPRISGHEG